MSFIAPELLFLLETVLFGSVVLMQLVKKNSTAVALYAAQSGALACLLFLTFIQAPSLLLLIAALATIAVKLLVAPYFMTTLIRAHQLRFNSSTYLNSSLTLAALAAIVAFTHTSFFDPLVADGMATERTLLRLSIAVILGSFFLVINRKGALSQMLGILCMENGIVSFALFAGLEESPSLQLGISFDILIWVFIASLFLSMLYRQFGSLDVTRLRRLAE